MKILLISPSQISYWKGGGAMLTKQLYDAFKRNNFDVTVISGGINGFHNINSSVDDVLIFRHDMVPRFMRHYFYYFPLKISETIAYVKFIKTRFKEYDAIIVSGILEVIPLMSLLFLQNKKVVLINHGFVLKNSPFPVSCLVKILHKIIFKLIGNKILKVIVYSNDTLSDIINTKIESLLKITELIPLPLDFHYYNDIVEQVKTGSHHLTRLRVDSKTALDNGYIMFIGRNTYNKGLDLLIKVFCSLVSKINSRLVIVGEQTPFTYSIINQLGDHCLERIFVLGSVDDFEKIHLMLNSSAIVVPSRVEGFGIVALESALLGIPVIATRTGNHEKILCNTSNAILIPPNSEKALSDSIQDILSGKFKKLPPFNKNLEQYDINNIINKYIQFK